MMWMFIGEVTTSKIMFPCAVPIKERRTIELSESKKMATRLSASLKPAKTVTDGFMLYHNLYSEIPVDDKHISAQEIVSRSIRTASLCDMIKSVGFYTLTYIEDGNQMMIRIVPVIVVYKDGLWENVSVSPIKVVETGEYRVNDEYGLGIILANSESEHMRPYAYNILRNPTSLIVMRKCRTEE